MRGWVRGLVASAAVSTAVAVPAAVAVPGANAAPAATRVITAPAAGASAAAAASVKANLPTVKNNKIWANGAVYNRNGSLSKACVSLWHAIAVPWEMVWSRDARKCISTPGSASHFFGSGSVRCTHGFWHTQVEAWNDRGKRVFNKASKDISIGFCD